MRKIITVVATAIILAATGCSALKGAQVLYSETVPASDLNTTRQTVRALRDGYNLGVVVLAHWVDRPRCSNPTTVSPLCTTRDGIIAVAKAQDETGRALVRVETLVTQTQPDASALSTALAAAKVAYATFQSIRDSREEKQP